VFRVRQWLFVVRLADFGSTQSDGHPTRLVSVNQSSNQCVAPMRGRWVWRRNAATARALVFGFIRFFLGNGANSFVGAIAPRVMPALLTGREGSTVLGVGNAAG
jgi:hypothetical protein